MEGELNVLCQLHNKQIKFLDIRKNVDLGVRALCEDCDLNNKSLKKVSEAIYDFAKYQPQIRKTMEKQIKDNQETLQPLLEQIKEFKSIVIQRIDLIYKTFEDVENQIRTSYQPYCLFNNISSLKELQYIAQYLSATPEHIEICNLTKNYTSAFKSFKGMFAQFLQQLEKIKEQMKVFKKKMANYQEILKTDHKQPCNVVAFNYNLSLIASGFGEKIKIYNNQLKEQHILGGHKNYISVLSFFKKQNILISVSNTLDSNIIIWEQDAKQQFVSVATYKQSETINSILIFDEYQVLLSCGKQILLLNKSDAGWQYEEPLEGHTNAIHQIAFNQDCSQLVSCGYDKRIIIWHNIDKQWKFNIKIVTEKPVYYVSFITNDLICYQESGSRFLQFAERKEKNFILKDKQKIELGQINLLNDCFFPMIYNFQRQLLLIKHNDAVFFLKLREDSNIYIEQKISGDYYGTISSNANYLALWDKKQGILRIYEQTEFQSTNKKGKQKVLQLNDVQMQINQLN